MNIGVMELSRGAGSVANMTVSGQNSRVQSTGIFVGGSSTGEGGTATLNVTDEAVVDVAGTLRARNPGTINIDGGRVTTQNFVRSSTGILNFRDGELTVLGSYSNGSGDVSIAGGDLGDNPTLTLAGAASTSGINNLIVEAPIDREQSTCNQTGNCLLRQSTLRIRAWSILMAEECWSETLRTMALSTGQEEQSIFSPLSIWIQRL